MSFWQKAWIKLQALLKAALSVVLFVCLEYAVFSAFVYLGIDRKIYKGVSPNVDFYSGFCYSMLGIPKELYTPLFAIARISGWSAHRLEELVGTSRIIRPAYMSVMEEKEQTSE